MEDLFKKVINAGVGFVSLTTDRVQDTIDKLVQDSKLSEKEGRKIMDDLKKNADTKRKEFEKQISGVATKMLKGVGVAPNSDLEALKRSVKGSKPAATTAAPAKKAAPAKAAPAKAAASSAASKTAGAVKKVADKTSAAAGKAQKSAAATAGAASKKADSTEASAS